MSDLPPTVLDDLHSLPARLQKARDRVRDDQARLALDRTARNLLIVRAVDAGMSQSYVAELAGVSQPHVVRVLAGSEDL